MERRGLLPAGIYLYGGAAMYLGVLGLVSGDFATNWQRVTPGVPHREMLAYLAGTWELAAGAAMLWRGTARWGALALAGSYGLFWFLWMVHAASAPQVWDSWGNVAEELSAVIAGLAAFAWLSPTGSGWSRRAVSIARLYGLCAIPFGLTHLIHLTGAGHFAPQWIPPGGKFWAGATGVFFLMGAASLLSGVLMGLASRLLGIMVLAFEALIWLPWLLFGPPPWLKNLVAQGSVTHFLWSGNGVATAFGAAAWVVADVINGAAKARRAERVGVESGSYAA
ncbi:MAG TPA: hypothetical protein VL990_18065 [Acidobacteriaceae bacterium]|nr:hypothetical protein [Acidobacteriaceae bacterium]